MKPITKEEIIKASTDYQNALIAEMEISQQEVIIKLAKIKAHSDTLLAKEALNAIKFT